MPYGVVMATGGAGEVAGLCGLHGIMAALTGVAVIQAILVAVHAVSVCGGIRVPRWRFGLFTIALGLAVIGGNLRSLAPVAGDVALGMAWLATLALGCWRIVLLRWPAGRTETVDGTWFLAPAALLGDALATAAMAGARSGGAICLAVVACLAGVAGYALVIAASGYRLRRRGLTGSPLAPWWISAGCGGLAAAACGEVADRILATPLHRILTDLVVTTWVAGTVLLIVVLAGCARYAWRRPRGPWAHIWTPVFSMAVYAAGTSRLARLSGTDLLKDFAVVTIAATLALWGINRALCFRNLTRHSRRRIQGSG
ncbi:MAG TPA: hypothetical protein VF286_02770 [Acidiphilium sp.]